MICQKNEVFHQLFSIILALSLMLKMLFSDGNVKTLVDEIKLSDPDFRWHWCRAINSLGAGWNPTSHSPISDAGKFTDLFTSNFNFEELEQHFIKGNMEMTKLGKPGRVMERIRYLAEETRFRRSKPLMTETIKLKAHTSCSRFKEQALPQEDLTEILTAAQMASSWKNFHLTLWLWYEVKKERCLVWIGASRSHSPVCCFPSLCRRFEPSRREHDFIRIPSNLRCRRSLD